MRALQRIPKYSRHWVLTGAALLLLGGCAGMPVGQALRFALDGAQEVPPVATVARGRGTITVGADRSVRASVAVSGMQSTEAYICAGARGVEGPVIMPLLRSGPNAWSVPAGAVFTETQFADYRNGDLYVNVYGPARRAGEIRGQIAYPPLPHRRPTWW